MANDDSPKHPDTRSERREKANRIADISHRIADLGRQTSGALDNLRGQLVALVQHIQADSKTTETRENKNRHDTIREVKRATNWTIGLTVVSIAVALITSIILYNQLHAMRIEHRAWVTVQQITIEPMSENKPVHVEFKIINTGKTPAKRIIESFSVQKVASDTGPNFTFWTMHNFVGLMPPNIEQNFPVEMQKDQVQLFNPLLLTKKDMDDILSGNAYIALTASIEYFDIYDKPHWLKYCFWKSFSAPKGSYSAKSCSDYNDVDNN